jgi:hypothetical protein
MIPRTDINSQVARNEDHLNAGQDAVGLLRLQLENPFPFKVAAPKCGARNGISGEAMELWADIKLAVTIVGTKGPCPSGDKLFAAGRERRKHELEIKTHTGRWGSIAHFITVDNLVRRCTK